MEPVEVVESLYSAWERSDWDQLAELIDDAAVFSAPRTPDVGKFALIAGMKRRKAAFGDLEFELADMKAVGDEVTFGMTWTGTNTGVVEMPVPGFDPIQPTGVSVTESQHVSLRVSGDKVVDGYGDRSVDESRRCILEQLGVVFNAPPF